MSKAPLAPAEMLSGMEQVRQWELCECVGCTADAATVCLSQEFFWCYFDLLLRKIRTQLTHGTVPGVALTPR